MKSLKSTAKHLKTGERRLAAAVAATLFAIAMTGCGFGNSSGPGGPVPVQGAPLQGKVFGGQQPVIGAQIQLYAAGTSGYGSAATPLLVPGANVTTAPGGSFNITGQYACPSTNSQVYLTATGGNSGYTNNPNLFLAVGLGPCGNLHTVSFIVINEVTTVATAYALSPFMSGPVNIGAPASNSTGLANAFADINTLVDFTQGSSPGVNLPAGTTVPVAEINTLADILSSCVNSGGGSYGDQTGCGMLFAAANPGATSSTAPSDTFSVAMNIAQHPGFNVSTIYGLHSGIAPFVPTEAQPNDFTIAVNFTGGNLNNPSAMASDALGNVWITNSGANTVTELSHAGAVLSGTGFSAGFSAPSAIAIDTSGFAWVTNKGNNTVSKLTNANGAIAGSPYSGGGLNQPVSISFDSNGTAWIVNSGNASVTSIGNTGSPLANSAPSGVSAPIAISVNPH